MTGSHVIGRWLSDRARATPRRTAIEFGDRRLTYGELDAAADAFAGLFAARGLERGDRVATLTRNSPENVAVCFACAKLGLILLPLSWRLSPAELAYQLEDAEPAVLLVEDEYAELAEATGRGFEPLREREARTQQRVASAETPLADVRDEDPLLLIYTSGTTGRPKGALLTHANCFWTCVGFDVATGVSGDDVVIQILPQYHVGGWNIHGLLSWWKGATVVLEQSFDAARCLALIEARRVTTMMGVPAVYLFMAQEPAFERADLSSLRRAVVGGAPMPEAVIETWAARGVDIVQGYGLTEAAPNVLCLPPEDALRKLGFAGKPYPFVDVDLSPEGELLVKGPNVFAGYWQNPGATAEAFTADGWLRTGDVAERDDEGYYRIRGRLKDMFISGGENVYPAEVEAVLHEHPAVADAAVVGMPDERWGEVGLAFVAASEDVGEDALVAFCAERLARFKVPKAVRFVDEIPRNAMGKIDKSGLRAGVAP